MTSAALLLCNCERRNSADWPLVKKSGGGVEGAWQYSVQLLYRKDAVKSEMLKGTESPEDAKAFFFLTKTD